MINPVSIIWFYFTQDQLKVVCETILRIECDNISACKIIEELEILCEKLNADKRTFETFNVNSQILELEIKKIYTKKQFKEQTDQFNDTVMLYIERWGSSFVKLKKFRWTQLINYSTWEDI